ncbi:hypothetical protein Geezett_054 [Klebsiella phage Geezett]|uniref:Uncharacterized protein n=1 Tax=Klebsiella phage Geezett TaxID=2861002 RepID=A0AAE7VJU5_9CAUD|nr:hypothetical protein PQZ59_gp54 [Klebsiella phage Geezett]QXV72126.1 hypothetical protein Geezett_054 [Klebsiella phage Geezett]
MSKLYKALDKQDIESGDKCWLVNDRGVAVSYWHHPDEEEVKVNMIAEGSFLYSSLARFKNDAIDPVLVSEW